MDYPLIIQCCVLGAELTRDVYPYLPLAPKEIAEESVKAIRSGAHIIHLHVRDELGRPSQRVDIFKEVTERIRDKCECIIQYSTGGAVGTSIEERIAPLSLKPDMASLTMGTINFGSGIFENSFETIHTIANAIQDNGVTPELEIFDHGMVSTTFRFLKQKIIPENFNVGMLFGLSGGMDGDVQNMISLVKKIEGHNWTASGIGKCHLPISAHAIAMGGHVRVGLEDNIYFRKGEYAKSNSQLVERMVKLSEILERPLATIKEAKNMLNVK